LIKLELGQPRRHSRDVKKQAVVSSNSKTTNTKPNKDKKNKKSKN